MTIEIDDETREAIVVGCSESLILEHSGSSYYRIKIKGKPEQIGTISGHHDYTCYPKPIGSYPNCNLNHLQIQLERKRDESSG